MSGLRNRRCGGIALLAACAFAAPAWAQATPAVDPRGVEPGVSELPIDEAGWARALVDALHLAEGLDVTAGDAERFGLLCPESAEPLTEAGGHQAVGAASDVSAELPAHAPGERVRTVVSVPVTGLYQLEVEGVGFQRWVVDGRPVGHVDLSQLGVAYAPVILPLHAGPHELTGTMLPQASAQRVRLSAWRSLCIAPADGWRSARPLTWGAWARTLVRSFGLEFELPEDSEDAQSIEGEAFTNASDGGGRTRRRLRDRASGDEWATAATSPAEFTWRLHLERPGVLTLSARTHGVSPQIWSVDNRHRVEVVPDARNGGFHWDTVTTLALPAGEHAVRARVARGSGIDALRLVARRSSDRDYVRIVGALGLPIGPPDSAIPGSVAERSLERPLSVELARSLRERLAGERGDEAGITLVDVDPQTPPLRPLSPALPSEL